MSVSSRRCGGGPVLRGELRGVAGYPSSFITDGVLKLANAFFPYIIQFVIMALYRENSSKIEFEIASALRSSMADCHATGYGIT